MHIAVIGATGLLGRHLLPRLVECGHTVKANWRNENSVPAILTTGAEPVEADILDKHSLASLISDTDAVVNLATSIPATGSAATWEMNDRIRRDGTRNLIEAAKSLNCPRIIQQSVCLVHAGLGDEWVNEASPRTPGPVTASAIEMEDMLASSGLDVRIARGGTFYGPGTARMPQWISLARAAKLRVPGDGSEWLSLIRVEDMASACLALTGGEGLSGAWLVVDGCPVTYRDLFDHLAAGANIGAIADGGPPLLPGVRASNAALLKQTGWHPAFTSWRSGLSVN